MIRETNHYIKKLSVEIQFEKMNEAIGMQDRIADVIYTRLLPRMNEVFEDEAGKNRMIAIDRLEIDSGMLSLKNWEDEWVETTLKKLTDELRTKHRKLITAKDEDDNINETFLYFLQYGHLPWNKTIISQKDLEDKLKLTPVLVSKLRAIFAVDENSTRRLLTGFSSEFAKQILLTIAENKTELLKWANDHFDQTSQQDQQLFYLAALTAFSSKQKDHDIKNTFSNYIANRGKSSILNQEIRPKDPKQNNMVDQIQEIYIQNAGLILVHPFLPKLFETTGLTEKNEWKDHSAQQMAVKILHYISSGNDGFEECFCPLNKILCGSQPPDPISIKEEISESAKEVCKVLLTDMIGYWEKLKNTSVDGFREAFIQRNGKLSMTENGWILQVEQNSIDVLMDYLPWGIGVVKLPWMKEILYTEW